MRFHKGGVEYPYYRKKEVDYLQDVQTDEIVDKIGIKKTISGNPIVVDDATDFKLLGFAGNGGTKQETRSGKNLFDETKVLKDTVIEKDGTLAYGKNYFTSDFILVNPNQEYFLPKTGSRRLKYFNKNKEPLTTNDWDKGDTELAVILTPPKDAQYVRFTINGYQIDLDTFQLEKGSEATPYEPYGKMPSPQFESPIINGELTHIKVNDKDNFLSKGIRLSKWDRVEKRNHIWGNIDKLFNHRILSSELNYINGADGKPRAVYNNNLIDVNTKPNEIGDLFCNILSRIKADNVYNGTEEGVGINKSRIWFNVNGITTQEQWKQFFDTNEVIVSCEKNTETFTPLPQADQEIFNKLETFKGKTTFTFDDLISADITYLADTKKYVDGSGKKWKLINSLNVKEQTGDIRIVQRDDGSPFNAKEFLINISLLKTSESKPYSIEACYYDKFKGISLDGVSGDAKNGQLSYSTHFSLIDGRLFAKTSSSTNYPESRTPQKCSPAMNGFVLLDKLETIRIRGSIPQGTKIEVYILE